MAIGGRPGSGARFAASGANGTNRYHNVIVALNDEHMAAAEGWRAAHGISDQAEALGELIRLGLLSEIAKIYRLVSENRAPASGHTRDAATAGRRKAGEKQNAV